LRIRRGYDEYVVVVTGLARQRASAKQAALLYEETPASQMKRAELAEQRKQYALGAPHPAHRPSKRDRRHIFRFTNQDT
jgi:ribosome-associated heat shock protein Hsp15